MHIQPKVNDVRVGGGGHNCPEQDDTESGSGKKKEVHDTRARTHSGRDVPVGVTETAAARYVELYSSRRTLISFKPVFISRFDFVCLASALTSNPVERSVNINYERTNDAHNQYETPIA